MRKNRVNTQGEMGVSFHPTKPALLALTITQALVLQAVHAASIEVTSDLDDGTDCTLREALTTISASTGQLNNCIITGDALGTNDTITFDPAVSGQTITITQGELQITKDVSINPGGVNTTIDGNQALRLMSAYNVGYADISVMLNQLTITGGSGGISVTNSYTRPYQYYTLSMTLTNSTVTGNASHGISVDAVVDGYTIVTLANSTVSGNTGDGVFLTGSFGYPIVYANEQHGLRQYRWWGFCA